VDIGETATQLASGEIHNCVLLSEGRVRCWGTSGNSIGILGYGNTDDLDLSVLPSAMGDVDVGGAVTEIVVGGQHTCALLATGSVRCWGDGSAGQLGYGNTQSIGDDEAPSAAGDVDVGGTVKQISAGGRHTCALLTTGAVRCWGDAKFGQLGYGNTDDIGDNEVPSSTEPIDVGGVVKQISAGGNHTCALLESGELYCWGDAGRGRLGYGNTNNIGDDELPSSAGPVDPGDEALAQVYTGNRNTCVLFETGGLRCWGDGELGQLGYGNRVTIGDDEVPSSVGEIDIGGPLVGLSIGTEHICALLSGGSLRCWGTGGNGKLGYGNTNAIGDDEFPFQAGDVCVSGIELSCP
jgi:alpha-tubulin suppressor-like RCC1 family protein